MSEFRLYDVSDGYINYLRQFDKRVYSNKEDGRVHGRKYLGVVFEINGYKYFVPMSSPKKSDYIYDKGDKLIRKNVTPIFRMTALNDNKKIEVKGTLRFSNMIPVKETVLIDYDVVNEKDEDYKILVLKEIDFIRKNISKIKKNAKLIYNQKAKNLNIGYLESTLDFKMLEEKSKEYTAN